MHWASWGNNLLWLWLGTERNSRELFRAENKGLGFWFQVFSSFRELLKWLHLGARFLNVLVHLECAVDLMTFLVLDIRSYRGDMGFSLFNIGNRVGPVGGFVMEALVGWLGKVKWLWVVQDLEGCLRYRTVHLVESFWGPESFLLGHLFKVTHLLFG